MAMLLPLPGNAVLVGVLVVLAIASLADFWAPAMAMLSDAAEDAGLDQALAFSISNLAWAVGHVVGAGRGRRGRRGHRRRRALRRARRRMRGTLAGLTRPAAAAAAQRAQRLGAVRPGRGAAQPVQLQRQPVLEPLGRGGRVAGATEAAPGLAAELVLAAVRPARRDGARVAARLALGDLPEDPPAGARWCAAPSGLLNGLSPSAPRVRGPTMPSGTRSCLLWKRFTARSVIGPKTPSAVMPSSRWMLLTAGPRSPRLTITSLEALAPPEAVAPGSASAGTAAPAAAPARAGREMRTTHGVEDPCHQQFPFPVPTG